MNSRIEAHASLGDVVGGVGHRVWVALVATLAATLMIVGDGVNLPLPLPSYPLVAFFQSPPPLILHRWFASSWGTCSLLVWPPCLLRPQPLSASCKVGWMLALFFFGRVLVDTCLGTFCWTTDQHNSAIHLTLTLHHVLTTLWMACRVLSMGKPDKIFPWNDVTYILEDTTIYSP